MLDNLKLNGKVIILGIGNTLRGDDGFGSILANRIKRKIPFEVIDAGSSPENYLYKITRMKPDTLLILDSVDFGGLPGEMKIFNHHQLKKAKFYSTHNISLELLINLLLKEGIKNIIILGIQPKEVKFKRRLSKELTITLKKLEKELSKF